METIRGAAGVEDLDVEIISIKSWIMGAELSTAFRDRRVLLTGDAAHRTTPDGGVGMNTGLHSAHNLAWKVGAVVSGWAGPDLLDTYETERRPVAETNVAYSAKRGGGMIKMVEAVRAGDLDTVRAGIAARPPGGRQGMDLGFRYEEGAVASDGTTPPPVVKPGGRLRAERVPRRSRPAPVGASATASACRPSTPSARGFVLLTGARRRRLARCRGRGRRPATGANRGAHRRRSQATSCAPRPLRGALRSRARWRRAGPARRLRRLARAAGRRLGYRRSVPRGRNDSEAEK